MGAWGVGLLDNDTALDAVDSFEDSIARVVEGRASPLALLRKVAAQEPRESQGVLGVAQTLIDQGVDLRRAQTFVKNYIEKELDEKALSAWRTPKARRKILQELSEAIRAPAPAAKKVDAATLEKRFPVGKELDEKECGYIQQPFDGDCNRLHFWVGTVSANKHGFADREHKVVIPPRFDDCGFFFNRRAPVKVNGRWGLIDETGRWVLEPAHKYIESFGPEAVTKFKGAGGKWGYLGPNGEVATEPRFDKADVFFHGMAKVERDGKYGFVDAHGNLVIEPRFDSARRFERGRVRRNGKWVRTIHALVLLAEEEGFVDRKGHFFRFRHPTE